MLPFLIAGPMVRLATAEQVCIWLATSSNAQLEIDLIDIAHTCDEQQIQLGENLVVRLFTLKPIETKFIVDSLISYRLLSEQIIDIADLCYPECQYPNFVIPHNLTEILHGSCRNPHHHSKDALVQADLHLSKSREKGLLGSQVLLMSGDQIYADDVSGVMLQAIDKLIAILGIYKEQPLDIALNPDIQQQLYRRMEVLPYTPWQQLSKLKLGYWLKQDEAHFTSAKSANHLVSIEEFIAMYLLSLSPTLWQLIDIECLQFKSQDPKLTHLYQKEKNAIQEYIKGLTNCQRLFANISSLMMFDDHDVTDDWNLTANWEQNIYQNATSKRIVANGLLSYWLFQGWGNDAGRDSGHFVSSLKNAYIDGCWQFNQLDKQLYDFGQWGFCINTQPKLVVLDTRTHRWRNEQNFDEPSGLLDWEQLCQLEDDLIGCEEVILVSPAPVFGVKSIEAIQAIFNMAGHPLLVDVENWMAHEGAARKLMSIFKRPDTPVETLILSGDVHYSFCYSVQARFSQRDNRIWQLTASGIKNEFPVKLLAVLDKMDTYLYGKYSPLNFFTKRWQMKVSRHGLTSNKTKHLHSQSGISIISLTENKLSQYVILHGTGEKSYFEL